LSEPNAAVSLKLLQKDTAMLPNRLPDLKIAALCGVVLIAMLGPRIASATLGEAEVTVQADVAKLQSSLKVSNLAVYRVHELTLPSGTLLREFVGLDGNVFAVAWRGPTVPNLRQTMGKYFDTYVAAPRPAHRDHSHVEVKQGDLVVQAGGHMLAFSGRAYLASAIPAGVNLGDLH
jgi:Protein of unknown function (DUF2844)